MKDMQKYQPNGITKAWNIKQKYEGQRNLITNRFGIIEPVNIYYQDLYNNRSVVF